MASPLRLGTRGSLLAMAQSRWVAARLRELHPGLDVELVTVTTRGDRDRTTPLTRVRDAQFFSAELDDALRSRDVDLCVHSLKDLPPCPPPGIVRAGYPTRENPRDVVVFRNDVPARLHARQSLRIGTSSDRRQRNLADFLPGALPATGHAVALQFAPLRGPVEQRLARLHLPAGDPAALDGVVLALAGLARLWNDRDGRSAMEPLLAGVRWMVLPLPACPAAPGQGLLALETRQDDAETRARVRDLDDPVSTRLLAREQAAVAQAAPAGNDAWGATALMHETLGLVCHLRGYGPGDDRVERLLWDAPTAPAGPVRPWDGIAWQRACTRQALEVSLNLPPRPAVFAAYWHALSHVSLPGDARIWVSGLESWRRLAAQGLWVEGCGDNLGFRALVPTLECSVLGLPPLDQWTAVTYTWAVPGWADSGVGRTVATYAIQPPADDVAAGLRAEVARATHCYWSSAEQYHALRGAIPPGVQHACGAGKTLRSLRAAGLDPQPFPNSREWRRWLG